jgi:hypothetical protein
MGIKTKIALNFLPLTAQDFEFTVYRKGKEDQETKSDDNIFHYSLPIIDNKESRQNYWVTFYERSSYEKFVCHCTYNIHLTKKYLFNILYEKIRKEIPADQIVKINNGFNLSRIYLSIEKFEEGTQTIWIEPYLLKVKGEWGFLCDFHFFKNEEYPFDKRVQQLSLSLDEYYQPNKNYYLNKFNFVKTFIKNLLPKVKNIDNSISISLKLRTILAESLNVKRYLFCNGEKDNSQFRGLVKYSPFQEVEGEPYFYFIFKEEHRDYGRDLVRALKGHLFHTFSGMEEMFNLNFNLQKDSTNINSLTINDFNLEEIDKVLEKVRNDGINKKIVLFIFSADEEQYYFYFKNKFLREGIMTQGVHIETIDDETKLKWSVSSIGLQMFAKLGGIPWRVEPSNKKCLIVGIGQAHDKYEEDGEIRIRKFFAYSVLVDSSGKYISMDRLSENNDEQTYLEELKDRLIKLLEKYQSQYRKITFHIPFKIKKKEIRYIIDSIQKLNSSIEVVVLKINTDSKYFGYNTEVNSRIPYESSYIKLSEKEHLLWTEGLNYHNKKATRQYSNPLHIEFYYTNKGVSNIDKQPYLQDILNLTGANWRGFNAKSIPISMFYPQIVSKFIRNFNKHNLKEVNFNELSPWFL